METINCFILYQGQDEEDDDNVKHLFEGISTRNSFQSNYTFLLRVVQRVQFSRLEIIKFPCLWWLPTPSRPPRRSVWVFYASSVAACRVRNLSHIFSYDRVHKSRLYQCVVTLMRETFGRFEYVGCQVLASWAIFEMVCFLFYSSDPPIIRETLSINYLLPETCFWH